MRQFPRWQRLAGRAAVLSFSAVAVAATALFGAASASASGSPSISAAWGTYSYINGTTTTKVPETGLGPDTPTTLTYTIAGGTDGLKNVSFTDTLPTSVGAVLFDGSSTAGTYTGCTSWEDSGNVPGTSTSITVTGVTVPATTSCTIVFNVVFSTATPPAAVSTTTDSIGSVSAEDAVSSNPVTITPTDAAGITVLPDPTVDFTVPAAKAVYSYGQQVAASYTCGEPGDTALGTPGTFDATNEQYPFAEPSCEFGGDNDGAEVDDGGYLDTLEAGSNALTVTAENLGTGLATPSVNYTVKPFVVSDVKTSKTGSASYAVKLPIEGKLVTKVLDGSKTVGELTTSVKAAATVKPSVKLNSAGAKLLKAAKTKGLKVTLEVSFTPSADAEAASDYWANFTPVTTTVKTTGVKIK